MDMLRPSTKFPLNLYRVPDGVIQVFVKELWTNFYVPKAYVIVSFLDQVFQTSTSTDLKHFWYEGFEFKISYHQQLFGKIRFSIYESNFLFPDKLLGSFEISIRSLENQPEIFSANYDFNGNSVDTTSFEDPETKTKPDYLRVRFNYRYQSKQDPEPRILNKHGNSSFKNSLSEQIRRLQAEALESITSSLTSTKLISNFMEKYQKYLLDGKTLKNDPSSSKTSSDLPHPIKAETSTATQELDAEDKVELINIISQKIYATNSNLSTESINTVGVKKSFSSVDNFVGESYTSQTGDELENTSKSIEIHTENSSQGQGQAVLNSTVITSETKKTGPKPEGNSTDTMPRSDIFLPLIPNSDDISFNFSKFFGFFANLGLNSDNCPPRDLTQANPGSTITSSSSFHQKQVSSQDLFSTGISTFYSKFMSSDSIFDNSIFTCLRIWNNMFQVLGLTNHQLVNGIRQLLLFQSNTEYTRFIICHPYLNFGWRFIYYFNKGATLFDGTRQDSDIQSIQSYLKLDPEDILDYNMESGKAFIPVYFVSFDKKYNAVVLSIRGTFSVHDLLVDLACEYEKWHDGLVHSGVRSMAEWLFINVVPMILAYAEKNNIPNIIFVGHSLGAGTAALLTLMIKYEFQNLIRAGLPISNKKFMAFTFGSLPSVSEEFMEPEPFDNENIEFSNFSIHTFVYEHDMIPSLSYGSFLDAIDIITHANDISDSLLDSISQTFEDKDKVNKKKLEKSKLLSDMQNKTFQDSKNLKLWIPGNIYFIHHSSPSQKADTTPKKDPSPDSKEIENDANKPSGTSDKNELPGSTPSAQTTSPNASKTDSLIPKVHRISRKGLSIIEFHPDMVLNHYPNNYIDSLTLASCLDQPTNTR
ncbi:hypothetical protein BB560_001149 [Smittium megazygosporum]|uniref:sn-1-specific diacylglycerol lipase n=1 Tax=Smittium megazygosporum TaxID=133381 RepID=A0A2T9ZIB7_9FUNG|nr:hypothetical protein BB560_001149 [Smittium megazygosporum]